MGSSSTSSTSESSCSSSKQQLESLLEWAQKPLVTTSRFSDYSGGAVVTLLRSIDDRTNEKKHLSAREIERRVSSIDANTFLEGEKLHLDLEMVCYKKGYFRRADRVQLTCSFSITEGIKSNFLCTK